MIATINKENIGDNIREGNQRTIDELVAHFVTVFFFAFLTQPYLSTQHRCKAREEDISCRDEIRGQSHDVERICSMMSRVLF